MTVLVDRLKKFVLELLKREKELLDRDLIGLKPDLAVAGARSHVLFDRDDNRRTRQLVRDRLILRKLYVDLDEQISLLEKELCSPHKIKRSAEQVAPPRTAEMLVGALTRKRYRDALLMDLDEAFQRDLTSGMSAERAGMRYWAAAINSIGPLIWAAARRIGLLGLLADYARRLLH